MPPEARAEIDLVSNYIKDWTKREISRIHQTEKSPICIPIDRGYRIGLYRIETADKKYYSVYNPNQELVHTFESRISAVLYTIYTIKQKYSMADNILQTDREINKNTIDIMSMRRCIERAKKQQDYDIVDIRMARVEIAEALLLQARDNLSKIHRHAKYNKVWDN
jgi:hypothetical protein